MAEYVIETKELPDSFKMGEVNELFGAVNHQIIRCRDCFHYLPGEQVCDRFGEHPSATGVWFEVSPLGFCCYGEPKREEEPLGFYRFPKNGRASDATTKAQAMKVLEEALETIESVWETEAPVRVCEEALDTICAAEGLLRKFPEETVRMALAELDRKATSRGDWF